MSKRHQVRGSKMNANIKVASITYSGKNSKEAYLNGCKDLAMLLQDEHITINIVKNKDETVTFNVFTNLNMNALQKDFCKICKDFHCSFFINEEYNCNRCNLKSYLARLKEKLNVSKGYYKSKL